MKYKVTLVETTAYTYTIEADSKADAMEEAEVSWINGDKPESMELDDLIAVSCEPTLEGAEK